MGCTSSQELSHQPEPKGPEAPKEVGTGTKSSNNEDSAKKVEHTEPSTPVVPTAVKEEEALPAEESPAVVPGQVVETHTEQHDRAPVAVSPEEYRPSSSAVPQAVEASETPTEPRQSSTNEASPSPAVAEDEPVLTTHEGEHENSASIISAVSAAEDVAPVSDLSIPALPPPLKKGMINKRGHVIKNWKNRYFLLDEGVLSYYESSSLSPPYGVGLKGQITLQNCELLCDKEMVIIRKVSSTASEKKSGHNELYLHIKYPNEREEWVEAIQSHIDFYNR